MLTLNLSSADLEEFTKALAGPMVVNTSIVMETLDAKPLNQITDQILGGQVNVDSDADITRSLEVTLDDPDHEFGLDGSADTGFLFADRQVRVTQHYRVPSLDRWVDVPLFCGPIAASPSREGDTLTLTAQGKEVLSKEPMWRTLNLWKKTLKSSAIRQILVQGYGESRLAISPSDDVLGAPMSLIKTDEGWPIARTIASGLGQHLFYDARGVAVLRDDADSSVFTFTDDYRAEGFPSITGSDDLINTVEVTGGTPKGGKRTIVQQATLPAAHPLSARSLGRTNVNGDFIPRYLVQQIEDETINTNKWAKNRATRKLDAQVAQSVSVEFDSVPIPHLEEGDLCTLPYRGQRIPFRLRRFTIPLLFDGDAASSIGYLRRIVPNKGRIRG